MLLPLCAHLLGLSVLKFGPLKNSEVSESAVFYRTLIKFSSILKLQTGLNPPVFANLKLLVQRTYHARAHYYYYKKKFRCKQSGLGSFSLHRSSRSRSPLQATIPCLRVGREILQPLQTGQWPGGKAHGRAEAGGGSNPHPAPGLQIRPHQGGVFLKKKSYNHGQHPA
jgi:hypothetical protein